MCKWTRISSYINTGYSIPAILTCWGAKSHGQWGGLLLDSLCLLIINHFHPLHKSWSAVRTAGALVRDMANCSTKPVIHLTLLIWPAVMNLTSKITLLCTCYSLPHSDAHSLSSPFQPFLQSLWLECGRLARLGRSSSLQWRNHRAYVTLAARGDACSKFVRTVCLIILINLQQIHYCLIQVRKHVSASLTPIKLGDAPCR